ncbi:MAG: response regulator [Bacilli bacterium]
MSRKLNILLVDDEVLALNYLEKLIDWNEHGFNIVDKATNGKDALELYKKYNPEIIISDIKMAKSDGIELTENIKKINSDVVIILLSAYKDFDYAKKAIEFGVENYIIKHELSPELLISQLLDVKNKLFEYNEKEKIYQKYFLSQLIYNKSNMNKEISNLSSRFCVIFVHRNSTYRNGGFHVENLEMDDSKKFEVLHEGEDNQILHYISEVKITENNLLILYEIKNSSSKNLINTSIYQKSKEIINTLKRDNIENINLVYSEEIKRENISSTFQKMSNQIRHSAFWKYGKIKNLCSFKNEEAEQDNYWIEYIIKIENNIYNIGDEYKETIKELFKKIVLNQNSSKEVLQSLESLLKKIEGIESIDRPIFSENIYKIEEIENYYISCFENINLKINEIGNNYSAAVLKMIRYIRRNYNNDITLETLGKKFDKNGIYLGNIFKKETGINFLKFLTNIRIEEAKKLLETGDYNIAEVAEKVGYKTSQYFSQIFSKSTGKKPQEYKNGKKE